MDVTNIFTSLSSNSVNMLINNFSSQLNYKKSPEYIDKLNVFNFNIYQIRTHSDFIILEVIHHTMMALNCKIFRR